MLRSYSGKSLPTFRGNLSVPSSRVNKYKEKFSSWNSWPLNMRQISCSETSVRNYHTPHNTPEERRSHIRSGGSLWTNIVTAFVVIWSYESLPLPTGFVIKIRTSNFRPELTSFCSVVSFWAGNLNSWRSKTLPNGNFRPFDPLYCFHLQGHAGRESVVDSVTSNYLKTLQCHTS